MTGDQHTAADPESVAVITVYPPTPADGQPQEILLRGWDATLLHPVGQPEPVLQVGGWAHGVFPVHNPWIYSSGVSVRLPGRGELPRTPAVTDSWYVTSKADPRDPWVRLWLPAALHDRLRRAPEDGTSGELSLDDADPWGAASFTAPAPGRHGHPPCPACDSGRLWLFVIGMAENADPAGEYPLHQINAQAMTCRAGGDREPGGAGCGWSIMVRPGTRVVLERS